MALVHVDTDGQSVYEHRRPGGTLRKTLQRHLKVLPRNAPLVILIHGFRYSPFDATENPHQQLFAETPTLNHWKVRSWPQALGFNGLDIRDGLCIGFGWPALSGQRDQKRAFAEVYENAGKAGAQLAQLVGLIAALDPGRVVDIVCHSVGASVALTGLGLTEPGQIGRVLLLGAAEYQVRAQDCLQTRAGRTALIYNLLSKENRFYNFLFETFGPYPGPNRKGLGRGGPQAGNWVDIRLDCPTTLRSLRIRGIDISSRLRWVCHWSFYLRPGVFSLYQAILRMRSGWHPSDLVQLGQAGPQQSEKAGSGTQNWLWRAERP